MNGIDISNNLFSGELPFNASGWYVVDLYARDNYLSGTIPTDLAFLKHIENLDISNNLFVGALPGQLNQVQYVLCVCVILVQRPDFIVCDVPAAVDSGNGGAQCVRKQLPG